MSIFDPSADYLYFDGVEAVTFKSTSGQSVADTGVLTETETDTAVSYALQRAVTAKEIEDSGGVLRIGDVRWHIPNAEITPTVPKAGDRIVDANSASWRILIVDEHTLTSRWRCWCRQE